MLHDEYIRLVQQVGGIGGGSTQVSWPHPDDFNLGDDNPIQKLYGLHYVATMSRLGAVLDRFYEMEQEGYDVAETAEHLVIGLSDVLSRAELLQQFAQERNRSLSAG